MRTIRQQLLIGLLCGTAACTLLAGAVVYREVREEANELSDVQLRQVASTLPTRFAPNVAFPAVEDPDELIVIQAWDRSARLLYSSRPQLALPRMPRPGFGSAAAGGERWRTFTEQGSERVVQVSQPMSVRDNLAVRMALEVALPLLGFILILGVLIVVVVERALRPLASVAQAVAGRSPSALAPLELDGLPPELRPIVDSLNGLLGKIDHAMTMQRNFIADAAHELRSPLTALKLQLQLAERASGAEARALSLAKLRERLDRSAHLVEQLLALARHDSGHATPRMAGIDLYLLAQQAVADNLALADSRAIDLGLAAGSAPVVIEGDGDGLRILLNNLIDNAIRYTHAGGQVDVFTGLLNGRAILSVNDNGPGVPVSERERVFHRFYRPDGNTVLGCGLGLSIVRNIVDRHDAAIELDDGEGGVGLNVRVVFPFQ
jgi:two-component system OmpR family sensor kinase